MPEFNPAQLQEIQAAVAATLGGQQPQAPPAVPQADLAAAAAAAVAAVAPAAAAVDINAIAHTIPSFWPEDVDGFFSTFEAACVNKKITQDGTKYSKLLSVLSTEARSRMVSCCSVQYGISRLSSSYPGLYLLYCTYCRQLG